MKLNPDFGPNSINLPPLPCIRDPRIRVQVFTHRSVAARLTHVFEDSLDDPSPDNEKFEHLGDSVLGLVVTNMMFDLYPGLRVGPSTKIRSLVVSNSTLADISKRYRLPDRLRLHQAQALTLRASTNIQADVFEAFVGGLFKDQGLPAVSAWLRPLLEPFAHEAYHLVRRQHTLPPLPPLHPSFQSQPPSASSPSANGANAEGAIGIGYLALFNQQLAKTNRKVEWVHSDGNEPMLGVIALPPPGRSSCSNGLDHTPNNPGVGPTTDEALNGTSMEVNIKSADSPNGTIDGSTSAIMDSQGESGTQVNTATASRAAGQWYADPGVPQHLRIKGTHTTPVWYVKVYVDGEFYGRGRGNTKKGARNEAAREGLIKLGVKV